MIVLPVIKLQLYEISQFTDSTLPLISIALLTALNIHTYA